MPAWLAWITTFGVLIVVRTNPHRTQSAARGRGEAAAERHFAQARLISAMAGPEELSAGRPDVGRTAVNLVNGSDEPVYTLVVGIVFIQGAGPRTIEEHLQLRESNPDQLIPVTTASILPGGNFSRVDRGRGLVEHHGRPLGRRGRLHRSRR